MASSRGSAAATGWECDQLGSYRSLVPVRSGALSWLSPVPLWQARNQVLAGVLGDPTDEQRRAWVAQRLAEGAPADLTLRDHADREAVSFVVMGDTGEGDGSQYAVVPVLERAGNDTDFMVICSDVVYPAGGVAQYRDKFYRPYSGYPSPIYALPGNHDWYDSLTGFMAAFCASDPKSGAPVVPSRGPGWKRWLRRLLWRRAPQADAEAVREMRARRPQQRVQPGPYAAIEAGPLLLVLLDTGMSGRIDVDQAEWLRQVSAASAKPKVLLTGAPIYANGERHAGEIVGRDGSALGGTVDDIVTAAEHRYVAVIGGNAHNYQRYPVTLGDGRVIQYLVSGGGGAYLSATHQIPNIDRSGIAGVTEESFRCYPLRGDSLSHFSRSYDRRLGLGLGLLRITPDDAVGLMAQRVDITPPRPLPGSWAPSWRARLAARLVWPLPGSATPSWHTTFTELIGINEPPLFGHFLRVDATADEIVITSVPATGCLEHELDPVYEDRLRGRFRSDGSCEWTSETPLQ